MTEKLINVYEQQEEFEVFIVTNDDGLVCGLYLYEEHAQEFADLCLEEHGATIHIFRGHAQGAGEACVRRHQQPSRKNTH